MRLLLLASISTAAFGQWTQWLNEDVAYIVNQDERRIFQRLVTDEEREHFVAQFWLRRDPTPGTPVNEFKEEHYRRIAYANQRFAAGVPGWRTDRGKIYVKYGPPDEIESHPRGRDGGPPFEQWRYRAMAGATKPTDLHFEDSQANGTYALPPLVVKPGDGVTRVILQTGHFDAGFEIDLRVRDAQRQVLALSHTVTSENPVQEQTLRSPGQYTATLVVRDPASGTVSTIERPFTVR